VPTRRHEMATLSHEMSMRMGQNLPNWCFQNSGSTPNSWFLICLIVETL
jgi:hypothetical protein